jgi:hypothetical protein
LTDHGRGEHSRGAADPVAIILVRESLPPRARHRFGRRSSDGGQQREAIIDSLDMWPERVRQHLAAGRSMIGGHAGRERTTACPVEWLLQDPLLHHRVLERLAHEGSEAMTAAQRRPDQRRT